MALKSGNYIIPGAASIDYNNADEIESYSLYLIKIYEREGGFDLPRRVTPLIRNIELEMRIWCNNVKCMLSESPLPVVANLISAYDFSYRMIYRKAPARDFMRTVRINAVQRWVNGEKTISSTAISKILRSEIYSSDYRTLEKKYGLFYFGVINDWVKELQRTSTFAGISRAETYTRLKIIIGEDLFGEYGSNGADRDKRRWAENHIVTDLSILDTTTLRAYIEFVMAYSKLTHLPMNEYLAQYIALISELNSRQDLNHYHHSALTIDLALKQCALKKAS